MTSQHRGREAERRTIDGTDNAAVLGAGKTRNNGRYNGNGRHWATPPEVFDPLNEEFNFTLDPCCSIETAKCPTYFTEAENGLEQDWSGHRVFMNPPYGREIYAWTKKARLEQQKGALVVGLLPASCDLAWWHDDVAGHAEVRYIRGRVRFLTGGAYRASGFFASVIVVWRPEAEVSENSRLRDALRPFAAVAAHDIGDDEADSDLFKPIRHNRAPLLTVGDLRRAAALCSKNHQPAKE